MRAMVLGLTLGWLIVLCGSAAAKEPFAYSGLGAMTCAELVQLHPVEQTPEAAAVMSWSQGFMSGINMGHLAHREALRDLGAVPSGGQLAFLLNYCDKNQLHKFAQAVLSLYGALPEIPKKD